MIATYVLVALATGFVLGFWYYRSCVKRVLRRHWLVAAAKGDFNTTDFITMVSKQFDNETVI